MITPIEQSQALRDAMPELLSRTSPDDIEAWVIERECCRQDLQKESDKLSDTIREKTNAIRQLQGEIDLLKSDKRLLSQIKGDHALDVSRLQDRKWALIREKKAYNIPN